MCSAGDTFLVLDQHGNKHLHILISDPQVDPGNIVLVPVTSWEDYKDDTCILDENDLKEMPFLTHPSCIDFQNSLVTSEARLSPLIAAGRVRRHAPVSSILLHKIRTGAAESRRIPNKCLMILDRQNLI